MLVSALMSTPKFVDKKNARTPEQHAVYEEIEKKGFDPFEMEHFKKHHPHPILYKNTSWFLTYNAFPYKDLSLHLLLVHLDFITSIEQITPQGWSDLQEIIGYCVREFNLTSGGFFMRFGDTTKTGGTVSHLHAHIVVTDGGPTDRRSIYIGVGK
jgi:ATP adenylyltransferase